MRLASALLEDKESAPDQTNTLLLVTLPNIHQFKKFH